MDKLAQVLGLLRALRSVATQANYTDVYKGMESQCISTYRKCVNILKTVNDYEEIESIAPELPDSANMNEIGFAVEMLLSIVRSEEGNAPGFGFGFQIPRGGRGHSKPRIQWRHGRGPGRFVVHTTPGGGRQRHGTTAVELELRREMRERIEEEKEQFENEIEEIEDEIDELQDKIDEARDRLEERLDEIREEYEEKMEELEDEEDEDDLDDDEDEEDEDDEDENEPRS